MPVVSRLLMHTPTSGKRVSTFVPCLSSHKLDMSHHIKKETLTPTLLLLSSLVGFFIPGHPTKVLGCFLVSLSTGQCCYGVALV
jgi:hypothetical protein